jgi:hypothetical protein
VGVTVGQRAAQPAETDGLGVATTPAQQRRVGTSDEHRHRVLHRPGAGELGVDEPTGGVGGHGSAGQ